MQVRRPGRGAGRVRPQGTSTRCRPTGPRRATCRGPRGSRRDELWPSAVGQHARPRPRARAWPIYAHELSHNLASRTTTTTRSARPSSAAATGMWDMMSRGSFNGPGGQHTRWQIPPTQGASLGAQHNMRNKRFLNFIADNDILRLNRDGLAQSGMAVAEVTAREVAPGRRARAACGSTLDGAAATTRRRAADHTNPTLRRRAHARPTAPITGKYNDYTMEVVQQIGSDSFDPGHGVLISQDQEQQLDLRLASTASSWVHRLATRRTSTRSTSSSPTARRRRRRSATSASSTTRSFNAGLNSGLRVRVHRRATTACTSTSSTSARTRDGVLHYKVARAVARRRRPADARRGAAAAGRRAPTPGFATCTFPLKNTGAAAATPQRCTRRTPRAFLDSDIYRLLGLGVRHRLDGAAQNALATAKFGETVQVPVYVDEGRRRGRVGLGDAAPRPPRATRRRRMRRPARSATATSAAPSRRRSSLTLGTPAELRRRSRRASRKDYYATTRPTSISTAGDATLTRRRPAHDRHRPPGQRRVLAAGAAAGQGVEPAPATGARRSAARRPTLLSYAGPVSNDPVTVGFKQPIARQRRAAYGHVRQDADVHAVDHEAVGGASAAAPGAAADYSAA